MTKPRILILSTAINHAGADHQIAYLSQVLYQQGYPLQLVGMVPLGPVGLELQAKGLPIDSLGMSRGIPDPRALLKLRQLLRQFKPDILHSFMVHANLLARLSRLFYWAPIQISSIRNVNEGATWRQWAYRATNPLCHIATQNSRIGAELYVKNGIIPADKMRMIPNGVDTQRFQPDAAQRQAIREELGLEGFFVWLTIGRFNENKDYPTLLKAFAPIAEKQPEALLLVVGYGALQSQVEQLIAELGISKQVRFVEFRRDIPALMNGADAYVMSSAWEGMPNVLLEASASGVPVAATDVGGAPEIVLPEKSGYLVPARSPAALSEAMLTLMALSDSERQAMGAAGRAHVKATFSLERTTRLWMELYEEVIARKGIVLRSSPQ